MEKTLLLKRLDDIGRSLAQSGHALALIGLGSVGLEFDRLDEYSDLDFFVIVQDGCKRRYLDDLDWLSAVCPIVYCFRNTKDGYKLLFEDDIFCEFAVFELSELERVPFAPGRVVWKQPHVDDGLAIPAQAPSVPPKRDREWLIGEALTNLYIGLGRNQRGEKLSAMRFIQWYAVDRLLELSEHLASARPIARDDFAIDRRFEQRYPELATNLTQWMPGYEHNCEAALAILEFLEQHFKVNGAMAGAIRHLCKKN